jgi:tetratricopeptide (TPR) repeat protein
MPMRPSPFRAFIPITCLVLGISLGLPCRAEHGFVLVLVQDAQHHPVRGVEIGIEGIGGSKVTGDDGKAQLPVGAGTKEGDWLPLVILHSPPGRDLVMISPWDSRSQIPSFEDKPENFVRVVVVQRGDRAALESNSVLASLAAKINKANAPKSANDQAPREDPKANLEAVAKQYGLGPDEVDQAIRAWGAKTTDPYEAGLAALYERDFPKASAQLQDSLKQREEKLTADQKAVAQDQEQVADAAFFLGSSLYGQGKYRESAQAYERCLQLREGDPVVMSGTALSLAHSGEYARAEPLYRRALAIDEKTLGPDHPTVATVLSNLAALLQDRGDYAGAEPLLRRALAIYEKALGLDHPDVATALNNLAALLEEKGDFAGAEPMVRRAIAIHEKALGPNHPDVAANLNNLAELLQAKGDDSGAEPLYRRALAIHEKALGPDHPRVAASLNNLGVLLIAKDDYAGAEPLLRRALAINEKALGPNHPDVARVLGGLATLRQAKGDYTGAEPLFRRALAINEKALGPNHPNVALSLNNLAALLQAEGDYTRAEPLYRRALAVMEKARGPAHPDVANILENLAGFLYGKGDYARAEPLVRRALEIDTKALGTDHPSTKRIQAHLDALIDAERKKEK